MHTLLPFFLFTLITPHPISYQNLIFYTQGQAYSQSKSIANYTFSFSEQQAIIVLNSSHPPSTNLFNYKVKLIQQKGIGIFRFGLYSQKQPISQKQDNPMVVSAELGLGILWTYHLNLEDDNGTAYSIMESFEINKFRVVFFFMAYLIISLIVLPPGEIYYRHIQGISWFSILISIQLTIWHGINAAVTIYLYFLNLLSDPNLPTIISCLTLLISLCCISYHSKQKISKLYMIISGFQQSRFRKYLLLVGSVGVIIGVLGILLSHPKNVTTFAYFMSGSIYYMVSFLIYSSMKKYFFSYRLVLFDTLTIATISVCSYNYPVNKFRMFSLYKMMGVCFIVIIMVMIGGLFYILVNVVRKQIKQKKKHKAPRRRLQPKTEQTIKPIVSSNQNDISISQQSIENLRDSQRQLQ